MGSVYDFTVRASDGKDKRLSDYKGKVLLIVNVASQCGLTPQYEGLEKLYRTYKDQGFSVLAFPSNEFGGQEPGTMEEIEQFCRTRYDVTFDLFHKLVTNGDAAHPLYRWLKECEQDPGEVLWNFEKFVIGRDGQIAARIRSRTAPSDTELIDAVEAALAKG